MGAWDTPPTPEELKGLDPWSAPPTPEEVGGPAMLPSHAPPPKPTATQSGVLGAMQGGSFGFGDEVAGAVSAALPGALRLEEDRNAVGQGATLGDRYRNARDYYRQKNAAAQQANPGTYLGGQIAASVGAGAGLPAKGIAGVLSAAGQGVAQGAGYSDADSAPGLAGDAALGGGLGLAGHGAGRLLGAAASKVAGAARGLAGKATSRAGQQAADEAADALKSETSRLGGYAQDINRQVEWVIRLLDEEKSGAISQANKGALDAFRQSPAYAAIVNKAAERVLQQAPASAARTTAQEGVVQAMQQAQPQAVAARTAELLKPQVGADTRSFLKSYAEPMLWSLGAQQAANALGFSPQSQAIAAGAAGIIGGRTRAGKALYNRVTRPANQLAFANAIENAATRVGDAGEALPAAAASQAALLAALLRKKNGEPQP